jgi:hypothetical protein
MASHLVGSTTVLERVLYLYTFRSLSLLTEIFH